MISYQSGKKNDKADALTRKPNEQLMDDKDEQCKHIIRVILPPSLIEQSVEMQPIEENPADHKCNLLIGENSDCLTNKEIASEETFTKPSESTVLEQIIDVNQKDEFFTQICTYLENSTEEPKPEDVRLTGCGVKDGLLMKDTKLWVLEGNQL